MKLRISVLPLIIFATFGYFAHALDRASVDGVVTKQALVKELSPIKSANHKNYN